MSVIELNAAIESSEVDVDHATLTYFTIFFQFRFNNNHKRSQFQEIKNVSNFIQARNRGLFYWRNQKAWAISEQTQ